MKYISTRGQTEPMDFSDVLLMGLAPDGGLMLPEHYPQIDNVLLDEWRTLSYPQLAMAIMQRFATDIPAADLQDIIERTYTAEVFGSAEIVPVRKLEDNLYILGLSNGPTLAFKDVAMQFLGNAFEYVLKRKNARITIIGATSGDTGSAAEYALRGKDNIEVFMLSPHGKMSEFQRAQMYSLTDANIHNIAIDGMFDDCQDIVKALQQDAEFKAAYNLGTVNSINWGRILAQIVYYFKAYFAVTSSNDQQVSFSIPSGNFGNICAGHIAREMGLPIGRLIVATNENDVLNDFFNKGAYQPRPTDQTYITSSPSMDISKASNFERFVYLLLDKDSARVSELFEGVKSGQGFDLSDLMQAVHTRYGFAAGKSTHENRLHTIKALYEQHGELVDPHTADGIKVAKELQQEGEVIICAETALPVKFAETIVAAIGALDIARPAHTEGLEDLAQHVVILANDAELVAEQIRQQVKANAA
jgi:threonine synthase